MMSRVFQSAEFPFTLYQEVAEVLAQPRFRALGDRLGGVIETAFKGEAHGDGAQWLSVIERLPQGLAQSVRLDLDAVTLEGALETEQLQTLEQDLRCLHPWRKGPYDLFNVFIDAEWRSDLKWDRLQGAIQPLQGRTVLDVGCGNGYHLWRMLGAGAARAIGIDPTLLSVAQFLAVRRLAGRFPIDVLPMGIEALPPHLCAFDTVFSMGVLYHRRSPIDHLLELKGSLRAGGELVLETLVIEGGEGAVMVPEDRYAQMRNVWFIPSPLTLVAWLRRCGFKEVRLVDVSVTTPLEQRRTSWMQFQSLADFLDPQDPQKTLEGLPSPQRAIFLAESA
jgi:tRNA (mo5U34)-methyltransferase